ncbi:MAG: hypothetical protein QGH37_12310 [Candidatus Poribacteria bacterium]|nr:hypothetical protein [Candidatus Poribacteria bacterium]MDP6997729.1 hypothetical protein [Candidatus Poribacteria bacterium]
MIVGNDGGFLAINNKGGTVVATVGNEDQGESTIVLYNHDGDFDWSQTGKEQAQQPKS